MVHKRPPAAGAIHLPPLVSGKIWPWQISIDRSRKSLAFAKQQISATVELLDGGATVPFVARYRKEINGRA